jgi:GT2 family glycosyltransferase
VQSLAELRWEHESVLASTSWRLTRPLRNLATLLRRLRDSLRFRLGRFRTNTRRAARTLETQGVGETLRRANRARQGLEETGTTAPAAPAPVAGPIRIPAADEPTATIVIPVYNNSELTRACLASIAGHAGSLPLEVIVVDVESADDTPEMLAEVEGIRTIRNESNRGFIDSCNRGAGEARGEFLVFLNNDTTVTPGWLEALVDTFEAFDDAGLVGAKLVYPDGRLQEAGGIIFNDASGWNYGRGDDPDRPEYNFVREADYCSGACIALRRRVFDDLGRFDERYKPAYYEDTDLAFKVRDAGLRVYYQPGCAVIHHEGATSGTDTATGTKRYQLVNQKTFRDRWAGPLAGHPAPGTDIDMAREHRLKGRVLIVDAVTPQPDQDSGSLRMVNLMQLFRSLGYGVTFIPDNLHAVQPYTARLQQQGVEMQHLPWLHSPPQWFTDHGRRFDAVILSRHYVAKNYLWLARTHCPDAALLFDTVDLHFLRERRLARLENRTALEKIAERTRREELGIARQSDMTLVVSPYEKEAMAREAPDVDVAVLSNIHEVRGRRREFRQRRDIWFVGGFQHPPNIDAMHWFTTEIWPKIRARLGDTRFHIVGSKMPPDIQSLSGDGIEVHGFVPDRACSDVRPGTHV